MTLLRNMSEGLKMRVVLPSSGSSPQKRRDDVRRSDDACRWRLRFCGEPLVLYTYFSLETISNCGNLHREVRIRYREFPYLLRPVDASSRPLRHAFVLLSTAMSDVDENRIPSCVSSA